MARLLGACDRRRAVGRRDFAIVTVLASLGLRAVEVARLRLDDIDWRAGEIYAKVDRARLRRLAQPWLQPVVLSESQRRGACGCGRRRGRARRH